MVIRIKFEATEEELKALSGIRTLSTGFAEPLQPVEGYYDPGDGDCCEDCSEFEEFVRGIVGDLFDAQCYLTRMPPSPVNAAIVIEAVRQKLLNLIDEDGE